MQERFDSLAKEFGDLVVNVIQSQSVQEIEDFLAFVEVFEMRIRNAKMAAEDRVQKLKIARKWESPN